jgi:hypothetical protein
MILFSKQVIEEYTRYLKDASPGSYCETFTDQVHGWMTSRYVFFSSFKYLRSRLRDIGLISTISMLSRSTYEVIGSFVLSLHKFSK